MHAIYRTDYLQSGHNPATIAAPELIFDTRQQAEAALAAMTRPADVPHGCKRAPSFDVRQVPDYD